MLPLLVALIAMLVLLLLLYVVPLLTYAIVRLVAAGAARASGRTAGVFGLWGEAAVGGAICALVALVVFMLGSEVPHASAGRWTAIVVLPAFVRVVRQAFARHAPSGALKTGATLLALATFAAVFAPLHPPLPLWQHVQRPNCVLDVRFDASGRVTGLHGDARACIGLDFTATAFATLDVVEVGDDCLVYRDTLLTFGREVVETVPVRGRRAYHDMIVTPMRERMAVMRQIGWVKVGPEARPHACR